MVTRQRWDGTTWKLATDVNNNIITIADVGGLEARLADLEYQSLLAAIPSTPLGTTPTVDATPAIKNVLDAGYPRVELKARNYLMSSPLIWALTGDSGTTHTLSIVDSEIFVDTAAMPTVNGSTSSWGVVFPNTLPTALSGGNITVDNTTLSADGGNTAAVHLENVRVTAVPGSDAYKNSRTLFVWPNLGSTSSRNTTGRGISMFRWTGYIDQHTHVQPFLDQAPGVAAVRLITSTATGGTVGISVTRNSVTQTVTWAFNASAAAVQTALNGLSNVTGQKAYGVAGAWQIVLPQSGTTAVVAGSPSGGTATLTTEPQVTRFVYQRDYGDGLTVINPKSNSGTVNRSLTVDLKNNRGAHIIGSVTGGMQFDTCQGVSIVGAHQEAMITAEHDNITLIDSAVTSRDGVYYSRDVDNSVTGGVFVIRDTPQASNTIEQGSTLTSVDDVQYRRMVNSYDNVHSPLIQVAVQNEMTSVIVRGLRAVEVTDASPGIARASFINPIVSDNSTVQAVIDADATKPILASGSFKLQRFNAWKVTNLQDLAEYVSPIMAGTHTVTALAGAATGGSLANGTTYHYAVAVVSSIVPVLRQTACATSSVAATSTGSIKLRLAGPESHIIRIWRKAGSAATTSPDTYVELYASQAGRLFTLDMGTHIAGKPWITYSAGTHPAPPSANNADVVKRIIDGVEY